MKSVLVLVMILSMATCALAVPDKDEVTQPKTDIGREIVVISQHLQTMAGDFTKSQIGQLTYYSLLWKFLIKPLFNIVFGGLAWVILNILLWKQAHKLFGKTLVQKDATTQAFENNYDFRGDGSIGAGIVLGVLAFTVNLMGFIVVFV